MAREQGMALALHVPQRTKLLLDLEGAARLSHGAQSDRCTPSRLVEEAVERAFGGRRGRRRPAALQDDEERRLRGQRAALGLTPQRLELLVHSLRLGVFRIAALGRLAGLAREPAGVGLRSLHARGLIRLRRLGPWRMSLWCAERGGKLQRWLQPEAASAPRLRATEERRLREMGRALGLRPARLELLVQSLKAKSFQPSELGAVAALRRLQARGLVRLEKLGEWRTSEWRAERGRALERALAAPGPIRTGALRVDEEDQLRKNASPLGLRPQRLKLLIHSLKKRSFRLSELARSAGMTRQGVQQALADLHERGLIRLRRLGPGRESPWRAERGEFLRPWL